MDNLENFGRIRFEKYPDRIKHLNLEGVVVSDSAKMDKYFIVMADIGIDGMGTYSLKRKNKIVIQTSTVIDRLYPRKIILLTTNGEGFHVASAVNAQPILELLKEILENSNVLSSQTSVKFQNGIPMLPIMPVKDFLVKLMSKS